MPKLLNISKYSLNIKVIFALFTLASFLLCILFLLVLPKMQEDQYKHTKQQIEQMIALSKEQIQLAGKALYMQTNLEISEKKYKYSLKIVNLTNKLNNEKNLNLSQLKYILEKNSINEKCFFMLKDKNLKKIYTNNQNTLTYKEFKPNYNKWTVYLSKNNKNIFNRKSKTYVYSSKLNFNNFTLNTICESKIFNKNHMSFEENIKTNIQKTFSLTQNIHKGKIYLLWINDKYINDSKPLFTNDELLKKKKYSISNMSNVKNIYTGDLSAKQIINAANKAPISHILNGKKAITWVQDISKEKGVFLFITTAYEEDFNNNIDSAFWKILPASLIALFLAIIAGFFLFKRLLKGITMLDKEVLLKTHELKKSLEEKDILLQEIHHRVKNNLALTISLIKLQQSKIKDTNTKKILNDIQERIYTMELVHRKLYESNNLSLIHMKSYINTLVNEISKTYKNTKKVKVILNIDNIFLDIEKTIPCALILNEIITNAFKYAFISNPNPKLTITMREDNSSYFLEIKDNGKGISNDINIYQTKTLGLKLINNISKLQLAGDFEYIYKKGAIFTIKFPKTKL